MSNNKTNNVVPNDKEQWVKISELYLDEWKHRDNVYYKFATALYSCAVVVSLFPYVKFVEDYTLSLNKFCFASAGVIIAIVTSLTIFGMSQRNTKVYEKYDFLLGQINGNFKHLNSHKKLKISKVLPWIILGLIVLLNVVLLVFQKKQG